MSLPVELVAQVAKDVKIDFPAPLNDLGLSESEVGTESAEEGAAEPPVDSAPQAEAAQAPEAMPQAEDASAPPEVLKPKEPVAEKPPEEKPQIGLLAERLAKVAEAEAQIRRAGNQLKRHEAEIAAKLEQVQKLESSSGEFLASLKRDPFGTLERAGVPFDRLLEQVYSNKGAIPKPAPKEEKPAEEEMPKWAKTLVEEVTQLRAEKQQTRRQEGEQYYRSEISKTLRKDEFKILSTMKNAAETIFSVGLEYASQTGEVLQPEAIAASLQEEWKAQLQELPQYDAVRELLAPKTPAPPAKSKQRSSNSEEVSESVTGLGGDMAPKTGAKQVARTREEQISLAAKKLGGSLWGAVGSEDEE
jgi:hypothetical protein